MQVVRVNDIKKGEGADPFYGAPVILIVLANNAAPRKDNYVYYVD